MTEATAFPLTPRRSRPDPVLSARQALQADSTARRVLMTVDAAGGVWRYAMELAHGLRPLGFDVVFVGQGPRPTAVQEAEARARGHLVWIDDPLDWMAREEGELAGLPATLSALVDEWQPDLLHLNNPSQRCDLLVNMPVLVVSHSCVATWWKAVKGGSLPTDWQWQFRRQRDGLMQADAVVSPSGSHAELLHRTYGTLPHLHVVPNAISAFLEGAVKEQTIFAAARWWDEGKNAAVLDRAAASVSWPVFMAGPVRGPSGGRVEHANAANADLPSPEVLERVSRAGIFVSPSLNEPFGLAALEAARAGAALVLSDIPTYRELWSGAAIFFDPRNADDLAAKIEYVAADPLLRADLGNKAIARSRRFTPDVQARAMAGIYRDLLDDEQPEAALENWA
jgi:glycosyltransferase involved in cell wall biosynthesis